MTLFDDANEQRLNVTGKGGRARELVLKFEGYGWRIHQPDTAPGRIFTRLPLLPRL